MDELRKAADAALRRYDIEPRRVSRAARSFNSVFRVTAASGTYALRVGAANRIHSPGALAAEGAWLGRLAAGGIVAPVPHTNRDGDLATEVAVSDGASRTCALFDWVPGRSLRSRLTGPTAAALGRLAARLHADADEWALADPPPGVPVADRVLYWPLPVRLTAPEIPFSGVFAEALARAQAVLDELWHAPPHRPHLLHGDLTPANVLVGVGGRLAPIDFQDVVWGFDAVDLAITVSALHRANAGPRLIQAFRDGYASCRPWPAVSPEVFDALIAARALNQINLVVNLRDPAVVADRLAADAQRLRVLLHLAPASG